MIRQWVNVAVAIALWLPAGVNFGVDPEDGKGAIHFVLSDIESVEPAVSLDGQAAVRSQTHYPNCVSHQPGRPRKPLLQRAGDINVESRPAARYGMDNHERSGNPDQVARWARCAVNKNYSAWFVGGGTSWIYPLKGRARTNVEGTWGMDYDGFFCPRRIWMNWGCDREQGGLGAYETDGAPAILEKISLH